MFLFLYSLVAYRRAGLSANKSEQDPKSICHRSIYFQESMQLYQDVEEQRYVFRLAERDRP